MYTTKSQIWDKGSEIHDVTSILFGNSFLFSKADAIWKAKRQASAHAFYKDKLVVMLETMKDILGERFDKWTGYIEESPDKTHTIDISTEFMDIMAHNIITVAFGEDINDELFELECRVTPGGKEFVTKKVSLGVAIQECFAQIIGTFANKVINPLVQLKLLNYATPMSTYQRQIVKNCEIVR